ncbi:MAG: hypothetical protein GQF41_0846 [Candidatus Rifleibacterium amylolyticum]|nr:MAG: hypothetical protein GQF41_0846 [Candidatus Rifleibacterium amylolyticum]
MPTLTELLKIYHKSTRIEHKKSDRSVILRQMTEMQVNLKLL